MNGVNYYRHINDKTDGSIHVAKTKQCIVCANLLKCHEFLVIFFYLLSYTYGFITVEFVKRKKILEVDTSVVNAIYAI